MSSNRSGTWTRGPGPSVGRLPLVCGLLVAWAVVGLAASAGAETENHHPANLTLFFPVGTNQDPDVTTNFRLSVIYGRAGSVRGLDLNGGVSILQRELRGVQATLLYSQVDGEFRGVAATGLVNHFRQESRGVQVAGLSNVDRGRFAGIQYAGLFNLDLGGLSGAQVTSVFNAAHGEGSFLQLAGVANMNAGPFTGAQIGGGINFASSVFVGAQIAAVNMAAQPNGFQGGLLNLASEARGIQLGALNWCGKNHGVPVGLVNIDETDGTADWITFGGSLSAINTGLRTTVNRWYSMLTFGYRDLVGNIEEAYFLNWNFGYAIRLGRALDLDVDLGYSHIIPEKKNDPEINDRTRFAVMARALVEFRFSPQLALFGGGGVASHYSEYSSDAEQKTEPLGVLGISIF